MTFAEKLNMMVEELDAHKRDKKALMEMLVKERLNKSLITYINELEHSFDYLKTKDEFNLSRKMNKGDE